MLDESRKEVRSLRERNQELERVVEALRKTIMRQAELSSQRQDQQGLDQHDGCSLTPESLRDEEIVHRCRSSQNVLSKVRTMTFHSVRSWSISLPGGAWL